MDLNQLIQLLMQILQQSPNLPAGDTPDSLPPTAAPPQTRVRSENDQMMSQLMGLIQQLQMGQSGQQSMNASAGVAGGPYGAMGGRPRGS